MKKISAVRQFTNKLLDAIDEGALDPMVVLTAALGYMSEADVEDMCVSNGFMEDEEEELDEDAD